jgi:hypothetical protein
MKKPETSGPAKVVKIHLDVTGYVALVVVGWNVIAPLAKHLAGPLQEEQSLTV